VTFSPTAETVYSGTLTVNANETSGTDKHSILGTGVPNDFVYTTNNDTITIAGYTGSGGDVIIPSAINGLPVASIGTNAFYNNSSITGITISDSVTMIGDYAFGFCSGLADITIPNSVTNIGRQTFLWCKKLPAIMIPSSVIKIGDSAFHGCTNMTAITVDALNSIYSSLDGVLFNKSQTTLIKCPCGRAGNYTIPDSVTKIEGSAFFVTDITNIIISASVSNIGSYALSDGDGNSLISIMVNTNNLFFSSMDGVLFNKNQTTLIQCPGKRTGSYTIPGGVTSIGDRSFYYCTRLTDVIIPDSITSIGATAFGFCRNVSKIIFPSGITNIGGSAFMSCGGLTGVYFTGNAPGVGTSVFNAANNVTVYRLPEAAGWPSVPGLWAGRPTALWDSDADGISDPWEERYFGGPTNANPNTVCSNGINTVLQAYIAGLNPNDPDAAFRASIFPGRVLQWGAVPGRVYSIYWTTNLLSGFQCLESNIPWTRGGFTNPTAVPCGYYKIDVRME
jgi:hypothetical protein